MRLNYAQIFQAAPILTKLIDTPFPVGVSFSITGLIDALNPHLHEIDQYKTTLSSTVTDGHQEEVSKKFVEYLNTTYVEVPFDGIPLNVLGDQLKLTVREVSTLRFAFIEPTKTLCG